MLVSPIPCRPFEGPDEEVKDVKETEPEDDTKALIEPTTSSHQASCQERCYRILQHDTRSPRRSSHRVACPDPRQTSTPSVNIPEEEVPPTCQELETVDRLLFTKKVRVKHVIFLRGKRNRYIIKTPDQTVSYVVEEENSWWVGYFCYGLRPFQLKVRNERGVELMRINRPFACTTRVLPCQMQLMQVFSPPGNLIGTIEQQWSPVKPLFVVKSEQGEDLYLLKGPLITVTLFKDVQFDIFRADGSHVGSTCKRWQGLKHALFFAPISDRFCVAFLRELSVRDKSLLLAMTLLVDYLYYDT